MCIHLHLHVNIIICSVQWFGFLCRPLTRFIKALYSEYRNLHFTYLEINPLGKPKSDLKSYLPWILFFNVVLLFNAHLTAVGLISSEMCLLYILIIWMLKVGLISLENKLLEYFAYKSNEIRGIQKQNNKLNFAFRYMYFACWF